MLLEEFLRSLNSPVGPTQKTDGNGADASEPDSLALPTRMDTGLALQDVHGYRIERTKSPTHHRYTSRESTNRATPASASGPSTQSSVTDSASPASTQVRTPESIPQAQPSSKTSIDRRNAPAKRSSSVIHFRRVFVCVFIFEFIFKLLFALALGGVFGVWGFFLASISLLMLVVVVAAQIGVGVRWRVREIRLNRGQT